MSPSYSFAITADTTQAQSGIDRLRQGLSGLTERVTGSSDALSQMNFIQQAQALQGFGEQISGLGSQMVGFSNGILGEVLSAGGGFEAAMNQVAAVSGLDLDSSAFIELREQAKLLGSTTQFSASEAAGAMGFLAMAGFNTADVMTATAGVMDLAAAGNLDLARAADIASNVLSGYAPMLDPALSKSEQLAQINDILAQTATNSNNSIEHLGSAFSYVAPVAADAGVEFTQAAAALGVLGDAGIQGERGGTALRGILTKLSAPTGRAAAALDNIGFSMDSFRDSAGNLDLTSMLSALSDARTSGNLTTQTMRDLFGLEGITGASVLLDNVERLSELDGLNLNAGGVAGNIAETQMQGLQGAIKLFESAKEGLLIALADSGIQSVATGVVNLIAGLFQTLSNLPSPILGVITGITALIGVIGGVLVVGGGILAMIGGIGVGIAALPATLALMTPLLGGIGAVLAGALGMALPIIIGVVAAGALLYAAWEPISAFFRGFASGFMNGIAPLGDAFASVRESLSVLFDALAPAFDLLFGGFSESATGAEIFGAVVGETLGRIVSFIGTVITGLGGLIEFFVFLSQAAGTFVADLLYSQDGALGALSNLGSTIVDNLRATLSFVGETIATAAQALISTDFVQAVMEFFGGLLEQLFILREESLARIDDFKTSIMEGLSAIFDSISMFLIQTIDYIVNLGASIYEYLAELEAFIAEQILSFVAMIGEFFVSIGEGIQQIYQVVIEYIANLISSVGEFFASVGGSITSFLGATLEFLSGLQERVMALLPAATQPFLDMWTWARDRLESLGVFVRDNIESFTSSITGLFESIRGFAGRITSMLSSFSMPGSVSRGSPSSSSTPTSASASTSSSTTVSSSGSSATMVGSQGGDELLTDSSSSSESEVGITPVAYSIGDEEDVSTGTVAQVSPSTFPLGGETIDNSVDTDTRSASLQIANVTINAGATSDPEQLVDQFLRRLDEEYRRETESLMTA